MTWQPTAPPSQSPAPVPRPRTRSETLGEIAELQTKVAVTQTRVDGLTLAVQANANALASDSRDERSRRPTVIAVLALGVTVAAQIVPWAFGASSKPTRADLAEVRYEATSQAKDLEARLRALELALAELRVELASLRAVATAAAEAASQAKRDATGRARKR